MKKYKITEEEAEVVPCPKCGNKTDFACHSNQFAEDCCEIWVVCKCGYDPTATNTNERLEDVYGGTDKDIFLSALEFCWNDLINSQNDL